MLMRLQVRDAALPPARDPHPPGKTWVPRSSTRPDATAAMGLLVRRRIESRTTGVHVSSRSRWRRRLAGSTLSSPRPVRPGPAQQNSAPLAQSAERLHGKNPARNGVLTCKNADKNSALCSELDALSMTPNDLENVTQVTYSDQWKPVKLRHPRKAPDCKSENRTPLYRLCELESLAGPRKAYFCRGKSHHSSY